MLPIFFSHKFISTQKRNYGKNRNASIKQTKLRFKHGPGVKVLAPCPETRHRFSPSQTSFPLVPSPPSPLKISADQNYSWTKARN